MSHKRKPKTCCNLCQGEVKPYDTTPTGVRYRCQVCGHSFTKPAEPRQIKKVQLDLGTNVQRLSSSALAGMP